MVQSEEDGSIWMGQPLYTDTVLQKFKMEQAKSVKTPVSVGEKLVQACEVSEVFDQALYQSAVGSLLYLSTRTRPDIAYAVSNVAKFCSQPTKQHWTAVKRILRYLRSTPNYGLLYDGHGLRECVGYSDADWAGDVNDYKSTSGYVFQMGGTAVSWRSRKQSCVALSTAEAEYMALAIVTQEAIWIRRLSTDLNSIPTKPTVLYEDNQSSISMAKNPKFHGRCKHIGIKYHFVREQVKAKTIELKYCRTEDMVADILTKGLSVEKFAKFRELMGLRQCP